MIGLESTWIQLFNSLSPSSMTLNWFPCWDRIGNELDLSFIFSLMIGLRTSNLWKNPREFGLPRKNFFDIIHIHIEYVILF